MMTLARTSTITPSSVVSPTERNLNRLQDALHAVQHMRMLSLKIGHFLVREKAKQKKANSQKEDIAMPTVNPTKKRKIEALEGDTPPSVCIGDVFEPRIPTRRRMEILRLVGVVKDMEKSNQVMQDEISKMLEEEERKINLPSPVPE